MSEKMGAYVTIDGVDGTGKTTQAKLLAERTASLLIREPGATNAGGRLRAIALDSSFELTPTSELLIFSADRNLTFETITKPSVLNGTSVVSDRSYLSTVAYQGYGRQLPLDKIWTATELALDQHRPDMHILLDIGYESAQERISHRDEDPVHDRFENEQRDFFERTRRGFHEMAKELGNRAILIDSSGTIEEVQEQIYANVGNLLEEGVQV